MKYHVIRQTPTDSRTVVLDSCKTFEEARLMARACLASALDDTFVEVTHAGLTVWGPYVKGGMFAAQELARVD